MRPTQEEIITAYLRSAQGQWIPAYKLRSLQTPFGWIGHQGDRACRRLAQFGRIEHAVIGRYAHYRAKQPTRFESYTVMGGADDGKQIKIPIYN